MQTEFAKIGSVPGISSGPMACTVIRNAKWSNKYTQMKVENLHEIGIKTGF